MAKIVDARETRFGGYLEDYEPGDRYLHWPGKTVLAADNHSFCLLTMAASPVHIDEDYAAKEMQGGRNMVVGSYVYALLLGMSVPDVSGRAVANLGVKELRHVHPLYHGDTLYGESEIISTRRSRSHDGKGILTVRTTGKNQDGTVVCLFERSVLLPVRPMEGNSR